MAAPRLAALLAKVQFITRRALPFQIAPPFFAAFPVREQLRRVKIARFLIAPPVGAVVPVRAETLPLLIVIPAKSTYGLVELLPTVKTRNPAMEAWTVIASSPLRSFRMATLSTIVGSGVEREIV